MELTVQEDNMSLISIVEQSSWTLVNFFKKSALGISSFVFAVGTTIPVAIFNNWQIDGTFNFQIGVQNFEENPLLFLVPEFSTLIFGTVSCIITGKIANVFSDKKIISLIYKIKNISKNLFLNLIITTTNEIIKKLNEKLTTSSIITIDIFDDLLVTVPLSFVKGVAIYVILKKIELWIKRKKGCDFCTIGAPILVTAGYFLVNSLQTLYKLGNNISGENFIKNFPIIFTENTVNTIFRAIPSSLMYYQFNLLLNKDEPKVEPFSQTTLNEANDSGERLQQPLYEMTHGRLNETRNPTVKISLF